MIRVTARHIDDGRSVLVGDFPPSEIRPLMEALNDWPTFMFDPEAESIHEEPTLNGAQFVTMGGINAPRLGLEILFEG